MYLVQEVSLWRVGDAFRSERSKGARVTRVFHPYVPKGQELNAFYTGMIYRSACFARLFKYVNCEFDQVNGRYSYLQAAAIGSMHGYAYFQSPVGRSSVLGTHVKISFWFICFTVCDHRICISLG